MNGHFLRIRFLPTLAVLLGASIGCDKTPPSITILTPTVNETVSNQIEISVKATDNEAVASVDIFIGGASFEASKRNQDIYVYNWDTDLGPNGPVTILASAIDESDNKSDSDPIPVNVENYRVVVYVNTTWDAIIFSFADTSGLIDPQDSVKVRVLKNSGSLPFSANSPTNRCGTTIIWDFDVEVGTEDVRWFLWVTDSHWYVWIKNQGSVNISHARINQDTFAETYCSSGIPNDSRWYGIGYYQNIGSSNNAYFYLNSHPQYAFVYWGNFSLLGTDINLYQDFATGLYKRIERSDDSGIPKISEAARETGLGGASRERIVFADPQGFLIK